MDLYPTGNYDRTAPRSGYWLETVNQSLTNAESPTDSWMMPLVVEDTKKGRYYRVYIRHNFWYRYRDSNLPDFIKEKLGAIAGYTVGRMDRVNELNSTFKDNIYIFANQEMPASFESIGWRGSQNLFILSLTETQLYRVLDDAGVQSKGEGQESTG